MNNTERHAKNIRRFREAIAAHERENPTHTAHGIGLSWFDMERLGYEDGEELWAGITIHGLDKQQTGNLRVLCDGEHDSDKNEQETEELVVANGNYARKTIEAGSWKGAEEYTPRWQGH